MKGNNLGDTHTDTPIEILLLLYKNDILSQYRSYKHYKEKWVGLKRKGKVEMKIEREGYDGKKGI